MAARGYNSFGVFGVSPTDINSTFADLKSQGFPVASHGSCPARRQGRGGLLPFDGRPTSRPQSREGVGQAVRETGGKVKLLQTITGIVAIDGDAKILSSIGQGTVTATVVQTPVGQAEIGAWALALLRTKQCSMRAPGVRGDSGSFVVDRANISAYDTVRKAKTAELKQQFADKILNCG